MLRHKIEVECIDKFGNPEGSWWKVQLDEATGIVAMTHQTGTPIYFVLRELEEIVATLRG